jgi:hypothetical protein
MSKYMGPSPEGVALTRQLVDLYEEAVPGTLLDPIVPALIRYLMGDTCADWLAVPRSTVFDRLIPAAPVLLGVLERAEERSPLAAMLLDRLGALTTLFELSTLTRGRVMHYAVPDHLKDEFGVGGRRDRRWTPPPASPLLAEPGY